MFLMLYVMVYTVTTGVRKFEKKRLMYNNEIYFDFVQCHMEF